MKRQILIKRVIPIFIALFLQYCLFEKEESAGGGTATGNVEGVILSKDKKPVGGAQVALFKKKAYVDSPDEKFKAFKEADTDEEGKFYFEVDEGDYTIVASAKNKYAFIDDIEAGSEDATKLKGVLLPPGALKGNIKNTIELQSLGSIVIHLIGTDIFKNVEKDGTFLITDIPAGEYTMVSYSTFQDEFAPAYRKVTIYPDSTTDISEYELHYGGIPIPQNIQVSYDTANSLVTITWDSTSNYEDFQEFAILRGEAGGADHNLKQIGYTKKHKYVDSIVFKGFTEKELEYAVKVKNMLGEAGKYYGIHAVTAVRYDKTIPEILGFKSEFDTLAGVVHLSWAGFEDEDERFKDYTLYRFRLASNKNILNSDTIRVKSNTFTDTLDLHKDSKHSGSYYYEYHVAVRQNKWELMGKRVKSPLIHVSDKKLRDAIPMVENLNAVFDTLSGSMILEWEFEKDSFTQFGGYYIIRKIIKSNIVIGTDTLTNIDDEGFEDVLYPDIFDWNNLSFMSGEYRIGVIHELWGRKGESESSNAIPFASKKSYRPVVDAGNNKNVDISSMVKLTGEVVSNGYPIVKREWKIGGEEWMTSNDGKAEFITDSSFITKTINCYFRATDGQGYMGIDSMRVTQNPLIVTHNLGSTSALRSVTSTIMYFKDKYWAIDRIAPQQYGVLSSDDLKYWKVENNKPPFWLNYGKGGTHFFKDNKRLWVLSVLHTSTNTFLWKSSDGVNWTRDKSDFLGRFTQGTPTYVRTCNAGDKLVIYKQIQSRPEQLFIKEDCQDWKSKKLEFKDRGSKRVFALNNKICLYHQNFLRCSENEGETWLSENLWDENFDIFPDRITRIYSDNTSAIAFFLESPSDIKKIAIYRHGKWEPYPKKNYDKIYGMGWGFGVISHNRYVFGTPIYKGYHSIKLW